MCVLTLNQCPHGMKIRAEGGGGHVGTGGEKEDEEENIGNR